MDGAGFGIDRPAELSKEDDEYEAFRKRMMLAYRFRPNPLVRALPSPTLLCLGHWFLAVHSGSASNRSTFFPTLARPGLTIDPLHHSTCI